MAFYLPSCAFYHNENLLLKDLAGKSTGGSLRDREATASIKKKKKTLEQKSLENRRPGDSLS